MTKLVTIDLESEDLLDVLASLVHNVWCNWHIYAESGRDQIRGGETNLERWNRQARTPYHLLSEAEKESDRKIARQYIDVIDFASGLRP